ncbi:hypothetical protein [Mangrovicoccus algicola]|uniref:Uncharacterized protein n=1 Tax=Mangrovicoccus algicola TaxID=2771008 RepID=A0A8J7CK53_9RHOB|nr:hypothetical protein [Mangrovicoccus algicola]MBE3638326.1 hypothetical protein [Mangrovicoccus algicola]
MRDPLTEPRPPGTDLPPGGGFVIATACGLPGILGALALWGAGAPLAAVLLAWLGLPPLVMALALSLSRPPRPPRKAPRPAGGLHV